MRHYHLVFLLFGLSAFAGVDYYGAKSTEALLKFDGVIEVETGRSITLEALKDKTPKAQEIERLIEYQLEHLIGHFQSESFLSSYRSPGVLGDQKKIKFTAVDKRVGDRQKISYRFEGKTVFHSKVFNRSSTTSVPLRLPLNPYEIYSLGIIRGKNRCTDDHYNSEGDFFYFWDPDKEGCPLKDNDTEVLRINGELTQILNTTSTYPEYDRLYLSDELKVSVLFGYIDDDPKNSHTRDHGYRTFLEIKDELLAKGFSVVEEKNFRTINHLLKLEKENRTQLGTIQKVIITVLLSDSSTGISDNTFVRHFSEALKTSQIVAYDDIQDWVEISQSKGLE